MAPPRCRDGRCQRMTPGLCKLCTSRLSDWLQDLPELWVRLTLATPAAGNSTGEPVTGSREAPVPVRVDVLDHIAATRHVLAAWATAIMADRHVNAPTEHPAFAFHRVHHAWTATQPWADDYAAAVHGLWSAARGLLGDNDRRVRIGSCIRLLGDGECGETLYAQPDSATITCPACGADWTRGLWKMLGRAIGNATEPQEARAG